MAVIRFTTSKCLHASAVRGARESQEIRGEGIDDHMLGAQNIPLVLIYCQTVAIVSLEKRIKKI